MDWLIDELSILWQIIKFLLPAVPTTLYITIAAFFLALVIGLFVAIMRITHIKALRILARMYINVVRGIPLLVQIFFIYFGLSKLFNLDQFAAGVSAISICYSAYIGEIFRAGLEAIPHGQFDASRSLGFTRYQTLRYIIFPQSMRIVIPPLGNELIACLKDSSLVSIIGMRELSRAGREFISQYFVDFEIWFMVGIIYLVLTLVLSRIILLLEHKYRIR